MTHTSPQTLAFLIASALLFCSCSGESNTLAPPSEVGLHLARALNQLDLDDLDQAYAEVSAARASLPPSAPNNHPHTKALSAVETRIEREREARKILKLIGTTRATGDVVAAFALLKTIPRDTLAYDNAYDRHSDLPKLIEFNDRLAQLISTAAVRPVMSRIVQRLRGFDHQVRLQGPRRSPSVIIQPSRFIAGSCNDHIPCKSVSYYRGQPDPDAVFPTHDLPQFTYAQKHHFFIDITEVTAADFQACADASRCDLSHTLTSTDNPACNLNSSPPRDAHPMNCISLAGATQYCAWAGGRLPTELEWEVAARGEDGRRFPWGDRLPQCPKPPAHALLSDCLSPSSTSPIGHYPDGISASSLLDTAGNVAEWTSSTFHSPSASLSNIPPSRAIKGGDFTSPPSGLRAARRDESNPSTRDPKLGFRCAYDL